MFSSAAAQLVAVFVGCILYGIYLVTFVSSLQCIFWSPSQLGLGWKARVWNNRGMLTIILLMFLFSTSNTVLGFERVWQGFIRNVRSGNVADERLGKLWITIARSLSLNLQIILADTVLIYRCWIVYGKSRKVVVIPIFLWLAGIGFISTSMYMQVVLRSGPRNHAGAIFPIGICSWLTTVILNLYTTTMIVRRIWRVVNTSATASGESRPAYHFAEAPRDRLQAIMRIIVESAAIYTVTFVIFFITLIMRDNSVFITGTAVVHIIGIVFNSMLSRAKQASDSAFPAGDVPERGISFASPTDTGTYGTRLGFAGQSSSNAKADITTLGTDVGRATTDLEKR